MGDSVASDGDSVVGDSTAGKRTGATISDGVEEGARCQGPDQARNSLNDGKMGVRQGIRPSSQLTPIRTKRRVFARNGDCGARRGKRRTVLVGDGWHLLTRHGLEVPSLTHMPVHTLQACSNLSSRNQVSPLFTLSCLYHSPPSSLSNKTFKNSPWTKDKGKKNTKERGKEAEIMPTRYATRRRGPSWHLLVLDRASPKLSTPNNPRREEWNKQGMLLALLLHRNVTRTAFMAPGRSQG